MSILSLLASAQGTNNSRANVELAKHISLTENSLAVKELIDNLFDKNKNIQSDCIKTLCELGYLKPELLTDYQDTFLKLLKSKNNRLVWGGMIALAAITDLRPAETFASLDEIMEAICKGTVITVDNGVKVLAKLNKHNDYFNTTDPLLAEILWKCPIKQLPQYIEKVLASICSKNKEAYQAIIHKRKPECENESQLKRLEKALKQIVKQT